MSLLDMVLILSSSLALGMLMALVGLFSLLALLSWLHDWWEGPHYPACSVDPRNHPAYYRGYIGNHRVIE